MIDFSTIPSPAFVLDESFLRRNLSLIRSVSERSGATIILAFKAFANWKAFGIIKEYVSMSTASSIHEARLATEEMGCLAHTFSPAYTLNDFPLLLKYSSHITFNSLSQYERFYPLVLAYKDHPISCGLRINPEQSSVGTDLYNPCTPGSRLGILSDQMGNELPEGIEGLHFHVLCESDAVDLENVLEAVEARFGTLLNRIKWLNMGGGHLMTRQGYDTDYLVALLKRFKAKYPHLELILEPGSAFVWETGYLASTVVDLVENHGIKTAILDVSFACHMPDCLEMPYKPRILGAVDPHPGNYSYKMGGNSCLAGDVMGDWSFERPLQVGDRIVFEDMIHYTMVKTTLFNGIPHPSLVFVPLEGNPLIWKQFTYEEYKNRMD